VNVRIVRAVVGAVALLTVAGCGTSISIGHAAGADTGSNAGIQLVSGPPPSSTTAPASAVTVGTLGQQTTPSTVELTAKSSQLGTIVADGSGRSLYRFDKDSPQPSKTTCTGACQTTWPPLVIAPKGKVYVDGIAQSAVATVTRPDGSTQLTIGGWPVYYFSGDHAAGQTNGQGVNGTWFAVAPDGKKASTSVAPSTSSGTGSDTVLTSEKSTAGLVVATGSGQTVYVSSTDTSNPTAVHCTDTCANGFTPVTAQQGGVDIKGVTASDVGTVARPDGSKQLTLVGFPLYTSTDDTKPGDVSGTSHAGWFTISLDGDHQQQ
jgi:predicted lipoprotein with Yx(FWY)xxD motif